MREPAIIWGSISMVTRFLSVGLPSRRCDDIPEPCPITAALVAPRRVRQRDQRKQRLGGGVSHQRHRVPEPSRTA